MYAYGTSHTTAVCRIALKHSEAEDSFHIGISFRNDSALVDKINSRGFLCIPAKNKATWERYKNKATWERYNDN